MRPRIADADAQVSRRTGDPDRRFARADPHAPAIRCAPAAGYKWSAPVNPAGMAKHYLSPALGGVGVESRPLARPKARVRCDESVGRGALHGRVEDARARQLCDDADGLRRLHHRVQRRQGRAAASSGRSSAGNVVPMRRPSARA